MSGASLNRTRPLAARGKHGYCKCCSVEISWMSYEAREARFKLQYAGRLKFTANTNYSRRICVYLRYKNLKTAWIPKCTSLDTKYNQNPEHYETKAGTEWRKAVMNEVNDAKTTIWHTAVAKSKASHYIINTSRDRAHHHSTEAIKAAPFCFKPAMMLSSQTNAATNYSAWVDVSLGRCTRIKPAPCFTVIPVAPADPRSCPWPKAWR